MYSGLEFAHGSPITENFQGLAVPVRDGGAVIVIVLNGPTVDVIGLLRAENKPTRLWDVGIADVCVTSVDRSIGVNHGPIQT